MGFLGGLIEDSISIPDHPEAGTDIEALVGDWYHPGWHVRLARAGSSPSPADRLRMQWVSRPLRFRVFFGPDHAVDGHVVDHNRIEWANGGRWYKDSPLYAREQRIYSQNGEDGVLLALLRALDIERPSALEFGVENGRECNTRILHHMGGRVIQWDQNHENPAAGLWRERVTIGNLPELVQRHGVPHDLDVLSIDVDYYDFYFWWRLAQHTSPRVMIIEYNSSWPADDDRVVLFEGDDKGWDGTRYFGASLLALNRLARRLGYVLVYCEQNGINAFFVRGDQVDKLGELVTRPGDIRHIWRAARYGAGGHPPDPHERAFTTGASLLSSPRAIWDPG